MKVSKEVVKSNVKIGNVIGTYGNDAVKCIIAPAGSNQNDSYFVLNSNLQFNYSGNPNTAPKTLTLENGQYSIIYNINGVQYSGPIITINGTQFSSTETTGNFTFEITNGEAVITTLRRAAHYIIIKI